ncbi:hypothetical protein SLS62_004573 [Diatrype stigma]|uniref:Ribosomal protein L19 n=1 Tax=Diatrype stigma TaxID=117547 RepID=A0AAN9YP67_9PEZI
MVLTQSARRPVAAGWKSVLRRSRQQKQLLSRSMATETTPPSKAATAPMPPPPPPVTLPKFHAIRTKKNNTNDPNKSIRTAFAVYAPPPSIRETHPSPLVSYHAQQIRRLDKTGARTAMFSKKNPDAVRAGDVLQVTSGRGGTSANANAGGSTSGGEAFAGVCLSIRRAGVDTAILLRNTLQKVGVEMWFKIYSPNVQGIEVIWRRPKRARRARLTYMRKPKHDMGNVDHLVEAWRRTRNVFSSKAKGGKANLGRPSKRAGKR